MKEPKVYIVDDDFIFREVAAVLLKTSGFTSNISHFENGLEAYNELVQNTEPGQILPDVMLLDINMPVMNGWELLEELKVGPSSIRDQVQIHILTSSIAPEDLNLSKTYSFIDGYITKPLTDADVDQLALILGSKKVGPS